MADHEPSFGKHTRRTFLIEGAGVVAASTVAGRVFGARRRAWWHRVFDLNMPSGSQAEALRVLGRSRMRLPDSLPNPALAPGTDTMPQIEHVVVLMLENHSYDNILGMLCRGPRQRPRGDGFRLGRDGLPTSTIPYRDGREQRAFRMPTTCQLHNTPSNEWAASHNAYNNGRNDGFVSTTIDPFTSEIVGPVAMGYWTGQDLPLLYALARTFPIGDRWFSSCLGQTDPQRRYLIAATSSGMTDDIGAAPAMPWRTRCWGYRLPTERSSSAERRGHQLGKLRREDTDRRNRTAVSGERRRLFEDAHPADLPVLHPRADGKAAAFSLLDPDYGSQSPGNPQNMAVGEGFLGHVIDALRRSPQWRKTLFILVYDEHGGYYDHVPPPRAIAPDSIPPVVRAGESTDDGFARYGFASHRL